MEIFSTLPALCVGNTPVTGEFPAQRPVTQSFYVFCTRINGCVNTREASDLILHRVQYDVIVMLIKLPYLKNTCLLTEKSFLQGISPDYSQLLSQLDAIIQALV